MGIVMSSYALREVNFVSSRVRVRVSDHILSHLTSEHVAAAQQSKPSR
jgi:hypothetical protein